MSDPNFSAPLASGSRGMMTDRERDRFKQEVLAMAAVAHARHGEVESTMRPVFRRARDQHPDEEHYLLELWDQITLRRMV